MSSAISAERIIEGARRVVIAEKHRKQQEAAQRQAAAQTARELFDSQKPALLAAARRQHEERFAPLRAIIDPLIPVMQALRDSYFPGRPIAVADAYLEDSYARGSMILFNEDEDPEGLSESGIIYAVVTCVEPPDRRWLKIGPPPKPRYSLNTGVRKANVYSSEYGFFKMLFTRTEVKDTDPIDLTAADQPFSITMNSSGNGEMSFGTPRQVLPTLHYWDSSRDKIAVANPETFVAENAEVIEQKFSRLLAPWARRQLMAQASV